MAYTISDAGHKVEIYYYFITHLCKVGICISSYGRIAVQEFNC